MVVKSEEGIDYRQILCAILRNELLFLEYAAGHDEDDARCYVCRQSRPKWGWCENCGTRSAYLDRLIEVTTFFESEFAFSLCMWVDIDYDAYIKKSKELFLEIPPERRLIALKGAAEWWKR